MPKSKLRVWFNQGISNVHDAVSQVRAADAEGRFVLLASGPDRISAARAAAHEFLADLPRSTPGAAYVDWCLETCRDREVDVFYPSFQRGAVAARRDEFAAAGVRLVLPGGADFIRLASRKDDFYAALRGTGVSVPEHAVASDLRGLDAAVARLRASRGTVCVRPTSGIGGRGFRILLDEGEGRPEGPLPPGCVTTYAAYRRSFAPGPKLLVSEYMPGVERSIDCLAHAGRLVVAVPRVKHGHCQVVDVQGPATRAAAAIAERFGLSGIFNVQTKDSRGEAMLIEVNARMSGGLLFSCLSGVALPYWAVMLAVGACSPEDVPRPVAGRVIVPVESAVAFDPEPGEIPGAPPVRRRKSEFA